MPLRLVRITHATLQAMKKGHTRWPLLVAQTRSAFCSSASQYLAAVGSCHSLAETMFHLAMTLFRLISAKHVCSSFRWSRFVILTDNPAVKHYIPHNTRMSSTKCACPQVFLFYFFFLWWADFHTTTYCIFNAIPLFCPVRGRNSTHPSKNILPNTIKKVEKTRYLCYN